MTHDSGYNAVMGGHECPNLDQGIRPCQCNLPRCPKCGYTRHDAAFEMDHGRCSGQIMPEIEDVPAKYRKKPVVVEAEQFDPGDKDQHKRLGIERVAFENGFTFSINTLEGRALGIADGDWIITGVNGERYPCKPDIFEKTYEAVDE